MSFDELQQRIKDLEALFEKESQLAPLMKVGDIAINLTQIKTCVAEMQYNGTHDHVKFLLCRTIDTAIISMQKYANSEQHQMDIHMLLKSAEFTALQSTHSFLIAQQQQWYPAYLLQEIREIFAKSDYDVKLRVRIEEIAKDPHSDWKTKTEQIDAAISMFTKSSPMSLFGDKTKPLKVALQEKMDAERPTITCLNSISLEPTAKFNTNRKVAP